MKMLMHKSYLKYMVNVAMNYNLIVNWVTPIRCYANVLLGWLNSSLQVKDFIFFNVYIQQFQQVASRLFMWTMCMGRILATPKKILYSPKKGIGKHLVTLKSMVSVSLKSHLRRTVSGRMLRVPSITVTFKGKGELKTSLPWSSPPKK